jgi:hypothetical protein
MAYGIKDFLADLAILNAGAALGPTRVRKAQGYALKKGFQLSALVATQAVTRGLPALGRAAAVSPAATGVGLGLGALATPQGQTLLELAAERGAADRRALEQAIDERIMSATRVIQSPQFEAGVKSVARRKVSKYSKAVKASMAAVKASKFGGKKGTISNAKTVFGTVNKVVSAVNKNKKVSTKGIRGTIARAARRVLK